MSRGNSGDNPYAPSTGAPRAQSRVGPRDWAREGPIIVQLEWTPERRLDCAKLVPDWKVNCRIVWTTRLIVLTAFIFGLGILARELYGHWFLLGTIALVGVLVLPVLLTSLGKALEAKLMLEYHGADLATLERVEISPSHLMIHREGQPQQPHAWRGSWGYRASPDAVLIYITRHQFIAIAREMCANPNAWQQALRLIGDRVSPLDVRTRVRESWFPK